MTLISTTDREKYLTIASTAANLGGRVLKEHWGKLTDVREKSAAGDLVTEADHRSEDIILNYLKKFCPTHTILSEETGLHEVEGAEFVWAVDPLDGTTNYTHQVPFVAVSIGLLHKGHPVVGVVYNPFINEEFKAAAEMGAFLNNHKIDVSMTNEMSKSLLATGFAYDRRETPDNNYAEFCYITSQTQGVRRMGSAALDLAYVAAGRFDGFWERGLNVWDIAAGIVLVKEAGGTVSSYENEELVLDSGRILASNGKIHHQLSKSLLAIPETVSPIIP
ncbi:MAG: inositol monophosphatase family protein [Chlamydiota bacterium]|nr:inositol monophosphatase family protein [Chlamydiota bacterium]